MVERMKVRFDASEMVVMKIKRAVEAEMLLGSSRVVVMMVVVMAVTQIDIAHWWRTTGGG